MPIVARSTASGHAATCPHGNHIGAHRCLVRARLPALSQQANHKIEWFCCVSVFFPLLHETCLQFFIHLLLPFLAPSLEGCGCYPCFVMCPWARSSAAAD